MISVKVYYFLAIFVLSLYAILSVLSQMEPFKSAKEKGLTFAFEAVLAMVTLVVGLTGIWFNGYEEGRKHGKTESDTA